MGREVEQIADTPEDRRRYREKVRRCLDTFALMLSDSRFDFDRPLAGLELEVSIVDDHADPAMRNAEVLDVIDSPLWRSELGKFNIELNLTPRPLPDRGIVEIETALGAAFGAADHAASTVGVRLAMIGTLPTVREVHARRENLTDEPRYVLLNDETIAARGEDFHIDISGAERLSLHSHSIAPEAACTSAQFHLQVSPVTFANYWNAAQAIAGVQVATAANSPYVFGRQLWHETRIALCEQATDPRPEEMKAQGVRPRVWFGERWIDSPIDLFEENSRYFPALLPEIDDEEPADVLARGGVPTLAELRLHNGTVYRWNRPVYDAVDDVPHLRVENRVLPSGPTPVDIAANAAFYYGLTRALSEQESPIWTRLSFSDAERNLHSAARDGIHAMQFWPGLGTVPATELVLDYLLPLAHQGLRNWGVNDEQRDHLLGIIERRCATRRNGATWQVSTVNNMATERIEALRAMMLQYLDHIRSGEPVHTWKIM